ncbi:MAG: transposase [Anaerolineaceae bacterium]|nr:transposase [Anaerolineaceae bacterium]
MRIQQFRKAVYQSILKRADAILDLIDALTVAGHVDSPVALSEETPFRRKFSSIFDTLQQGEFDFDQLLQILYEYQPGNSEQIADYEVYALDCTPNERPEAVTLEDRGSLKTQKNEAVRYGHKYSWLVRLISWGTSWTAPVDIQRVDTSLTDSQVASAQVKELDLRHPKPKVVVGDSLYGNHLFLAIFLEVKKVFALVRLRSNLVFYEQPAPRLKGAKGAPAKHGSKFKLSEPSRPPDRSEIFLLGEQTVTLQAWQGLHFKKLSALVGMVLRVEFLRPDETPRYKRPMWLFWSGSESVSLKDLCLMYLWRFAIEHMFRFLKQHLGLNANQSTNLVSTDQWMWLCALAYWQLLLMRDDMPDAQPAWYPEKSAQGKKKMTPGQVQRGALRFLVQLGTPAHATRTAGKGKGRAKGYHPTPRQRFPIVKKAKTASNRAAKGT